MHKLGLLFILGFLSFSVYAIDAFDLRLPLDETVVDGGCARAFDQGFTEKEAYEAQPQINMSCASQLDGAQVSEMKKYFIGICGKAAAAKAAGATGQIVLDDGVLKGEFDTAYGAVFRQKCLDKEVSRFNATATYASASAGASAGASDRCVAFQGCN